MPAALRLPLLALLLLWSALACARGPLDARLHEAGPRRDDLLYVVLFSLPDCPYCLAVRDAYLPALPDDPRFRERVRIREISIGNPRLTTDFNGEKISHADVARRYKVKFAPTVLFLGSDGQPRAEPLLGGDSVGLYGGYLEKRVLQGLGLLLSD
jgi:thioredoxin-related protein